MVPVLIIGNGFVMNCNHVIGLDTVLLKQIIIYAALLLPILAGVFINTLFDYTICYIFRFGLVYV